MRTVKDQEEEGNEKKEMESYKIYFVQEYVMSYLGIRAML